MRGFINLDESGALAVMRKTVPFALGVTAVATMLVWITMVAIPPFIPSTAIRVSIWCGSVMIGIIALYLWVRRHPLVSLRTYNLILTITVALAMIPVVSTVTPPTWWRGICLGLAIMAAGAIHIQLSWMLVDVVVGWILFGYIVMYSPPPQYFIEGEFHVILEFGIIMLISTVTATMLMWIRGYTLRILFQDRTRIRDESLQDTMTGVYNRRVLEQEILHEEFSWPNVRVLFCDIRGLKQVNDQYGHPYGDKVIRAVSTALIQSVRDEDVIIRAGGDEFVVLTKYTDVEPDTIRERVLEHIRSQAGIPRKIWMADVTIGISPAPEYQEGETGGLHSLIEDADQDMYNRRREPTNE